jgi:hypothetical protein
MRLDTADLGRLESNGQLFETALHEMGHILGIGTLWYVKGVISGMGSNNPVFTGARAVAEYNSLFDLDVDVVPLENQGGGGTADSHWRESVFDNELMTGWLDGGGANPLSRITAASLADIGYEVNIAAADDYAPPMGPRGSGWGGSGGGGGGSLRAGPACGCGVCLGVFSAVEKQILIPAFTSAPSLPKPLDEQGRLSRPDPRPAFESPAKRGGPGHEKPPDPAGIDPPSGEMVQTLGRDIAMVWRPELDCSPS